MACSKCNSEKHYAKGLCSRCYNKQHHEQHRDSEKQKNKERYLKNKTSENQKSKEWYSKHKEYYINRRPPKKDKPAKQDAQKIPPKVCSVCSETFYSHIASKKTCSSSCGKQLNRNYGLDNYHKHREAFLERGRQKRAAFLQEYGFCKNTAYRKSNLNERLAHNLRSRLSKALKRPGKQEKTKDLLGCSLGDLKLQLEAKFLPGMTWENYGDWHIDHIVPLSSFDLMDLVQLRKACNYKNLQPLWAADNLRKSNKF